MCRSAFIIRLSSRSWLRVSVRTNPRSTPLEATLEGEPRDRVTAELSTLNGFAGLMARATAALQRKG
jgi:hypothetical protein